MQTAAHDAATLIPAGLAEKPVFGPHPVGQGEHPSDGRFRHRTVDRTGGDAHGDVVLGAGGDVDAVIADAEAADGQQLVALLKAVPRHTRRQHDDAVQARELFRSDLVAMPVEGRKLDARFALQLAEIEIWIARFAVIVEIAGETDAEGRCSWLAWC